MCDWYAMRNTEGQSLPPPQDLPTSKRINLTSINHNKLQVLLQSPVMDTRTAHHRPFTTLKITILRVNFLDATNSQTSGSHCVYPWKERNSMQSDIDLGSSPLPTCTTSSSSLGVATWNCRGLQQGKEYICDLLQNLEILILNEQWLWPYSLYQLGEIHPRFDYVATSDHCLIRKSTLIGGYGGVAILWQKPLCVTPVESIESDKILTIKITLVSDTTMQLTIIDVYIPDAGHPIAEVLFGRPRMSANFITHPRPLHYWRGPECPH